MKALLLCLLLPLTAAASALPIEDFSAFDTNTLSFLDGSGTVSNGALVVRFGNTSPYPRALIRRELDLNQHTTLAADITNLEPIGITVCCRVDNKGASGQKNNSGGKIALDPGETATLRVRFNRTSPNGFRETMLGMQTYPDGTRHGAALDPSAIVAVQFFANRPTRPQRFAVDNIRAEGTFDPTQLEVPDPFLPFVDTLGQYRHRDWPGKTKDLADLAAQREREAADLAAHPGPADRDRFGGWQGGPQLEATGHFYPVKRDGKWWLVTPEGRLFWSLGVCCVRNGGTTFVEGRESWFESLPGDDAPLAAFYLTKKAARGDYAKQELRAFDFGSANLLRKYGDDWKETSVALAHRRLKSWGLNTLGCWSGPEVQQRSLTPYVTWVFYRPRRIRSWGITRKPFPDVFDPTFETEFRKRATGMCRSSKDDPFCIGYFSDNELSWGDETSLARAILKAPVDQPAKIRMIEWLKTRHASIAALNAAWNTTYASWEAMLPEQQLADTPGRRADLSAFTALVARTYFETCRRAIRDAAPGKLYLGCRFSTYNQSVVAAAAEYCDVLSFNIYRKTVAAWRPPGNIDKPIVIGEFHFGAPDRGVFGSGLVGVSSQTERTAAIRRYVSGAARNPLIVGAHWFQYRDEHTCGRPLEGENHQIGLVDICDTPYARTVAAFREMGSALYHTRAAVSE